MEIRNLITFLHVAELNSFTKAAKLLDYSQSTVSFQIKQLESELDCLLFERINHTLILTDRGRQLLAYAHQVCRLTDEFRQSFSGTDRISGHVHIVTPDSMCEAMIEENYADFFLQYPDITLKFSTADTDDMFSILSRNEADIMLTLDNHVYNGDFIIAKEKQMETNFVVGTDSPLASAGPVTLADIINEPFILTEKGMGYRRVLDELLAQRSLELQPVLEIGRTDIITRILEHGRHISFLPEFATRKKAAEGRLVYLEVTDINADIWQQLIYHKNKWISSALATFIEYVKEHEFHR